VAEETGLEVRIIEPLRAIEYDFVQDGTRIHKTVHYFLMQPTGGDLANHDHEFERVRWVPFDEAGSLLTFATERELVAETRGAPRRDRRREHAGMTLPEGRGATACRPAARGRRSLTSTEPSVAG
jgi:ADP-ribose pyrophosphatase YjhB (NUDIX family)